MYDDELINQALQQAMLENGVENRTESVPETGNHPLSGLDFSQYAATSAMGAGRQSMTDREADLRSLGPNAYAQKYGVDAMLDDYAQRAEAIGQRRFQEHQVTGRGALSQAADLGLSFGNAAASSITGLSTLGMGLIDDELGARGARASDIISDAILGMQSKQMQAMRNIQQQDMDVRKRDNRSTSVNNLEMIGKDIVSTLQNYRGETVADDVAMGFGSLVGLGMLRKGGAAVGNQFLKGRAEKMAAARASGNLDEVARLQRQSQRMHTNAQTALIGASEAGGSYVDTVNQIMSMSHEQLMNSPEYRAIFEEVGNSTEAKQILANQAGQHSAMITAPIASVLGRGVAAWETAPLRHSFTKGLATNVKNTALQGAEEFGQGLGGAYATGDAIQQYADATYNPAEDMGEQAATGAVAGVGMSGSLNAPGMLVSGAGAGITKASDIFSKRIKKAELNAEKGAGIDAETVNAVSTAAQQSQADFAASMEDAVATMAPEEQERGAAQFQKIYDLGTHTDGQYDNPTLNQVTEGSSNKFEAINRLAHVAGDESVAPELRIQAGIALVQAANDVHDVINESPLIFENLADDHPAVVAANNIVDTVNAALQVKSVREAVTAAEQMIAEMEAPVVTEESFNTPEGQENVQTLIQLAEVAPDKVNVDSARVILAQAKQGTIELSPKQQRSLEYSVALMEAEANRLAIAPKDSVSIVSKQISLERGEKGLPLKDHIKNIQRAEQAKDTAALETAVNALANFVEHMNNKVSALNKSAQDGQNHQYMAYNPKADKWFQTDGKGLFFNPNSEASLNLAATVQHEAAVATDVLNNVYELLGSNERVANVSINSPLVPKIEAVSPQVADPFGEVADPAPSRQAFTEKEEAMYDKSRKNALREKLESQRGLEKDTDLDKAAQNMDTKSIEKELNRLNRKGAKKLTEQDKLDQAALRKELKNRSDVIMAPARAEKAAEEVAQEIRAEDAKKANAERVSETGQARTDAARAVSSLNGSQLTTLQMQAMEMMTQEEFDSFMKGEDIGLSIEELNAIKEMAVSIRKADVRPEPTQQVQEEAPKAEGTSSEGQTNTSREGDTNNKGRPFTKVERERRAKYIAKLTDAHLRDRISKLDANKNRSQREDETLAMMVEEAINRLKDVDPTTPASPVEDKTPSGEDTSTTPSTPSTQGQVESQTSNVVEDTAPKKSSPSFLAAVEAAVEAVKKVAPLVKELDSVEQSIKKTTDEDALIGLEDKAEILHETISQRVDEIIEQLIDQLDDMPKLVAEGIRDELNTLKDSEEESKVKLRDLSTILRMARSISNSTGNLFGNDTPSVTTTQSQQPVTTAVESESVPVERNVRKKTDATAEAEKKMPTTAERFPALARLGDIANNMFVRTFNLRGEDKNRLANEDSPVSFINSFLGSAGKISNLLGDVWGNKVTDHTVLDAWKDYMVTGDLLKEQVNKNLQTWLHAKKKSGSKFLDFSTQQPAFESADNVLIHLTEEGVDANGNPTYNFNEKLLEGSVLAAMSWLINDALAVNNRDIEDVAKTLGIHEHDVTPEVLAYYNEGVIKNFSIQDLGKKIQDFWGVSNKGDGYIGDQQGLTEGMARLLLDSMTQMGILKQEEQLVIPKTDGYGMPVLDAKGEPQTNPLPLKLVTQNALPAKEFNTQEEAEKVAEALQNTSSLLDELILTEPEKPIYVGKEAYPHKKSAQIRNSLANLTYQQKQVQKRANSKNFHVNTNMAAIFGLFGSEGITEAFSTVTQNPDMYNVKDFKIIEARNKAMASSFEELGRILYEVKAVSEVEGTSIHDTPIHFGHEFSSVNRLQQQGRYTPQSSKLLREVILPTWADMDLSGNNEQHLTNFRMMLAQAFDIALHKNTWENANAELTEVLSKLDGAIELTDNLLAHVDGNDLLDQYPSPVNFAKRLREEFDKAGVELSPLTLHALVEYTRFTKATNDELKNFRTSLYLEADGMTNGPANAMIMYSGSEISADWIGNMESAGMYINQPEANAGLKNNQKDAGRVRDLYEKGAERLQRLLRANQETLANSGVLKLFHIFENKSFSLGKQDDGLWDSQIGRNLIKNPLTVMLYGSGVSGVAGKLASNMLDSMYSEMSKALHRMHQNPELSIAQALFPSESLELSERRLAFFEEQLGKATSERGGYQRRYKFRTAEDLKNFQIVGGAFAQLTRNTFNDLAKPMHEAISETVGNKVMDNSEMIRNATNIMSIVAADLHKQLLDAEIEKNSKDKNYRKRQLVTFDRARELERQASEMAASMTSGTQNHLVQKVGEHEFKYDSHVAIVGAKSGSKGHTSTLGEAGVKGSAAMTISIDGQMVQNGIMTEKDIWQRQLEVFDGVNTPGDGIQDAGQQMNQAVWDSWNDNTMGMVADRFGTFLKNLDLGGLSDETKISITKLFSEKPRDVVEPYSDDSLANLTQNLQKRLDKEGKAHAALMEVLSEMPITVDQMAGTYNPLVRNPDVGMQPRTPEELAEYIQQKVNDKLGLPKYQTEGGYAGMLEGAKYSKDGNVVQQDKLLSATELYEIAKTGLMNRAQKEIMFRALKSGFLKNWRVLTGDAKSLRKRAKSGMIDGKALEDMLSKDVEGYADMGYYSEGRRTLVLMNDSVETLVHETIHATTYDKFDAFYHNESEGLSKTDIEAIQRIEALMEQFMAEDVADTLQHMPATMEKIQFVQKVVQDLLDQGNKAAAVNEFMSWTLGNDLLAERASRVKAPKFVQLARDVLKALKKLVFGDKAPYVGDDVLSNLVFNTAVLIQEQAPALETVIEDQVVLAQANSKNQSLTESVNNYITSNAKLSPTQKKNIKDFTDAAGKLIHVAEAIRIAKAAFPSMTEGDLQTFGMVNSVLATENGFDSKAMREAAHVYDHVIANLKVSDFAGDKITAQAKFNAVVGRDLTGKDEFGRTAMLPTFVGLAMTVPEVSEILSKMDMPPRWKSREKGMDGVIENIGFLALENLGNRFTDPKKTPQVQAAMEVLGNEFVRNQTESQNVLMGTIGKAGSMMDMANQKLVDGMQALANVLYPEMTKEEQEKRTSLQKGMDIFGAGIASIISEPHAKIVAKGVSEQLDKTDGIPAFLRDLSNDLIGRNDSNKLLWDMVKHFRSKIQVVRQNYRADLPKVIRSKFKKPLSRKVWASLNTSMGKTGIGSLALNGIDLKDAMTLAESSKERKARIKQLEGAFQHNTIEKAKQLAHFMNTRETGSYLLRNAEAIAKHTGHEGRVEAIAEIDHLVTLYALEGLSQADQNILSNLVKSEPEGMEFLIAYLSSQIAEERAKAVGTMAQFNYYKGNLPFEMKQDVSLRIADDAEGAKLISMGYKKLEAFKGSNLAPVRGKSYYYSPNSPTVAFSQGIVQNVRQTVSGVDMGTGHTLDTVVNRITKPHEVERITKNLHREKGLHLIPVFNEKGDVIAYEQRIDPNLEALVQDEADLASTIGKWRGRQVEEYLSKFSNDALVQNLVRTYENDLKESKSNADRYVDLFESTDPVVVDALSLMPNDLRAQISEAMDGKFLVQRGMVKDVLGYRKATYTDSWTGVTRWSPEAQKVIKNAAVGIMGEKAFTRLREAQRIQENLVLNAKVIIAVKSVVVPAINILSNMAHLAARGVPLVDIAKGSKELTLEIEQYVKNRAKYLEIEADARVEQNPSRKLKLEKRLQNLEDANRRMQIWPLIEAGEFSSVSAADARLQDVQLTSGKLAEYIESKVEKMPDSTKNLGRYAFISADTPLFEALQKSVEYGDFVAKAILYKDMTKRLGKSKAEALGTITEEFISYDHLPGRTRGVIEDLGMYWFGNFKLRSIKIAAHMIRNNPLHSIFGTMLPVPQVFGNTGIPLDDNLLHLLYEGKAGYSVGLTQGINSIGLNPWVNSFNTLTN